MTRQRALAPLITCEHGGNRVPAPYRRWFRGHARLLATHEGYDPGALDMARTLAHALGAPLVASTVSRLVVELNRSPTHRALFSRVLRDAPPHVCAQIYERHYVPYRNEVEALVARAVACGALVVHLSSHSFTPVLDGEVRRADVGLLYDPARRLEADLARRWRGALLERAPEWRVRRNYPYRGSADGLTTYLRRRFGERCYAGIELEINQARVRESRAAWHATRERVVRALQDALATASARP